MESPRNHTNATKDFATLVVRIAEKRFEEVSDNAIPTIVKIIQKLTKKNRMELWRIFHERQRMMGYMPDMAKTKQVCADGVILCPEAKNMCVISDDFIAMQNHTSRSLEFVIGTPVAPDVR